MYMYLKVFHMANAFSLHFNGTLIVQIPIIVAYMLYLIVLYGVY